MYNVLLGDALKLSVNVSEDYYDNNVKRYYFPAGTWCNIFNTQLFEKSCITNTDG